MSPTLPATGFIEASDDWDDSFDMTQTAQQFELPSSASSSSSSHRSRNSLNVGSPLRQSFPGSTKDSVISRHFEDNDDDFEIDLPDSFPATASPRESLSLEKLTRARSSTASSTSSMRNIPQQVIGTGPTGIGTVTRLGGPRKSGTIFPPNTLKAKAKALERTWEADVDFDDGQIGPIIRGNRLTLSPPKKHLMPSADVLDDLGFDLDEEDQETLKAGATIKAMLPPPRLQKPAKTVDNEALEVDFALPLSLTNLTLANLSPRNSKPGSRLSGASWGSPSTSSGSKSKAGGWSWGDEDSPRHGKAKQLSDSSATSMSEGPTPDRKEGKGNRDTEALDDEEDMESGLILPNDTFFSTSRAKELNFFWTGNENLSTRRSNQYPWKPLHTGVMNRSKRVCFSMTLR